MAPKTRSVRPKTGRGFNVEAYLDSTGPARKVARYRRGDVVFSQGDPGDDVRYIQNGGIRLSVLSRIGKEAVVAMLGAGDFFGEGALAGQTVRIGTATAVVPTSVLIIEKQAMIQLLHDEHAFSDRFISYMLTRNMRIEADLVDQRSTPAKSDSPERCCCWRGTVRSIPSARCRRSRRRRWRK